jgi:hypothetical protein
MGNKSKDDQQDFDRGGMCILAMLEQSRFARSIGSTEVAG